MSIEIALATIETQKSRKYKTNTLRNVQSLRKNFLTDLKYLVTQVLEMANELRSSQ